MPGPRIATLLLAAGMLMQPPATHAQGVPEYELKAAFVFNFALFTDWPAQTTPDGGELIVCVDPASPMRPSLEGVAGKMVKGRRFTVRAASSADNLRACQLLIVDSMMGERWVQLRKTLENSSVLTVTDDDALAKEGVMVTLAMQGQRLVFDINLQAARRAGLALSSKLLRLARSVN